MRKHTGNRNTDKSTGATAKKSAKNIHISGPMKGYQQDKFPLFNAATAALNTELYKPSYSHHVFAAIIERLEAKELRDALKTHTKKISF